MWWNKNYFGNVRQELEEKKRILEIAEEEAMRRGNNLQVRALKVEINILANRESQMWSQRSRFL